MIVTFNNTASDISVLFGRSSTRQVGYARPEAIPLAIIDSPRGEDLARALRTLPYLSVLPVIVCMQVVQPSIIATPVWLSRAELRRRYGFAQVGALAHSLIGAQASFCGAGPGICIAFAGARGGLPCRVKLPPRPKQARQAPSQRASEAGGKSSRNTPVPRSPSAPRWQPSQGPNGPS